MPLACPKPCSEPGCRTLVVGGGTRCQDHKARRGSFGDRTRGSRHERGYGAAWDRLRVQVLRRDAGICQHCLRESGAVHQGTEVDHRVPKAQGGTDDLDNLQTICKAAHRAKTQAETRGTPGGGQISSPSPDRTDQVAKFSRAAVSAGGVPHLAGGARS